MSPDEIRRMIESLDWARMLSPDSPFADRTFRRKEDARAFPSSIEFGLKGGFKFPGGLSPAEQVNLLLARVTLPYFTIRRFDELPIPFKCVAVDLRAASPQVILESGRLQEALRATMAIPGVFTPVEVAGRVLVDGGVLNNVPADVARAMGADVVLAVNVGTATTREKRSDSLFAVMSEAIDVMMQDASERSMASADLVLVPDLTGFTIFDFGRLEDLVRLGYAAAEAHRDGLLKHAVSDAEYRDHLEARRARRKTAIPRPEFLDVEGVTGAQASVIRRQLQRHVKVPLDTGAIERDLLALTGSNRYDTVTYRLEESNGRAGLVVTAHQRPHAPPYLLAALDIYNTESASVSAAIRSRFVFFDVVTPGSETRLDLGVGDTSRAAAEWALALGSNGLFVAPRGSYTRVYENLFDDGRFVAEYRRISREAGLDLGFASRSRFEARFGYGYEWLSGNVHVGSPAFPEIAGAQRAWRARAVYDGQTSPVMPDRGLYARLEARRFTSTAGLKNPSASDPPLDPDDLTMAEVAASYFHPVGRRGRVYTAAAGGSSFGDTAVINGFTLGGPLALGAYQRGELRGSNYALAHLGYFHEVARVLEGAFGRLYAGGWVESGAAFERARDARIDTCLSGGFIMETLIGPAFLTGSVGLDGKYRVYVGLGPLLRR
jgi:NTE family protein